MLTDRYHPELTHSEPTLRVGAIFFGLFQRLIGMSTSALGYTRSFSTTAERTTTTTMSDPSSSTTSTTPLSTPWRSTSRNNHQQHAKDQSRGEIVGGLAGLLPSWTNLCLKTFLGVTVGLYILNQKHLLPKPLSRVVSKALFWPTLPITVSKRLGAWVTVVDDTVVMGGAPFGFWGIPETLYQEFGVS